MTLATKVSDGTIDLVARAEPGREADQVQRRGAVGDRERVAGARVLRQRALELLGPRAHAEPAGAVDVGDDRDVLLGDDHVRERNLPGGHGASVSVGCAPPMRAVVLAGGLGMRLRPYTTILPKPLLPIGDRPILEIILRQLAAAGSARSTCASGTWAS